MVKAHGDIPHSNSRDELIAGGRRPRETGDVQGRPASVGVIVEDSEDGSLRVVVQGFMLST